MADFLEQLVRQGPALREIDAGDLHVERRRRAEIEDLADDIGRKERERRAGERLRQLLAQPLHIDVGRRLAFIQRHQNVGVEDADGPGIAVGNVDAADGEADVVDDARHARRRNDRADLLLDLIGQRRRLLDSGSRRRAQMQLDRAGIDRGEEILSQRGDEAEREQCDAEEPADEPETTAQRQVQQAHIGLPEALKTMLESARKAPEEAGRRRLAGIRPRRMAVLMAQEKMRERRHQRVGQYVRGDHREDDRHRERPEEVAGDPAEREQRREGDADAEQRDRRRRHDFACAMGDGGQNVFAELLHVAIDVLDGDRRVVDENADRERETAERHHVDRLAERGERDQRGENRQGDRDRDDEGRAPAAEKDEDHEARQGGRDQAFAGHRCDGRFDEARLIPDESELDPGRQRRLDRRQARLDAGDDVEGRGGADLQDRHQHAFAAVELHDIGLRRRAIMDIGDVAHEDDGAVDHLDRQIIEVF